MGLLPIEQVKKLALALGYLVLELLLLTVCVHFLGGVEQVGVLFYGLIIGAVSLVLPIRRVYSVWSLPGASISIIIVLLVQAV